MHQDAGLAVSCSALSTRRRSGIAGRPRSRITANMVTPPSTLTLRRVAAVLEVLGIYLAGRVVTGWIVQALKLHPSNPLPGIRVDISDAALLTAAWQIAVLLLLQ